MDSTLAEAWAVALSAIYCWADHAVLRILFKASRKSVRMWGSKPSPETSNSCRPRSSVMAFSSRCEIDPILGVGGRPVLHPLTWSRQLGSLMLSTITFGCYCGAHREGRALPREGEICSTTAPETFSLPSLICVFLRYTGTYHLGEWNGSCNEVDSPWAIEGDDSSNTGY